MQVFINECSLNEQFNQYDFPEAIKKFIRIIKLVNQINRGIVFRSVIFFNYKAIKDTHIGTYLKTNIDLNNVFSQNLKNAIKWEAEQVHDKKSSYIFNNEEYVKTSIAEITERKIITPLLKAVLINFVDSKFANNTSISVQKNHNTNTNIGCAFDESSIYEWLIENDIINPNSKYDENNSIPPLDEQTILNSEQFETTQWRNGKFGRKVYRLKGTKQLWVVDNSSKHANNKAHIEIFDEITKKHMGTSIYNKIELNEKYVMKNRTINLT